MLRIQVMKLFECLNCVFEQILCCLLGEQRLDVSELAEGIYALRVIGETSASVKFVKQFRK